jgi:NAD(P)-dependent dehydrogenase (short-subunit alcohol dehydrogenase family)
VGDLTATETVEALINSCPAFDGLASCAGIASLVPLRMSNEAHLQKMLAVNYLAPLVLTQKLLLKKKLNNGASLVFVTALAARVSPMAASAYAASKAALDAASRTIGL